MRRVVIHGCSGSGKTTLANSLAKKLGVKHVELDSFFHEPNWQEAPPEAFRARVAVDGWVVDGNYRKARDLVYARCDTVLWLDYPMPLILWRLTGRILRRGLLREELWNGNRESIFRHFFTRESLYLWVFQSYGRRRADCRALLADPELAHLERICFRSPGELRRWLARNSEGL